MASDHIICQQLADKKVEQKIFEKGKVLDAWLVNLDLLVLIVLTDFLALTKMMIDIS
jgi:hypothetical protein